MGAVKRTQFLYNRKLAEPFKGPFRITKVRENGTALIRGKNSKHADLVNTNLLVKYNKPHNETQKTLRKNTRIWMPFNHK
jgi:hypothetical protein